ncbi:MAG: hypothetical protein ACO1O6_11385 [Bacteroidota bacterium]
MDIYKLLLALEEFLYEVVLSIFLIPKTLYRIIVSPTKMYRYILEEFTKKPEERFDRYMSPLLLFILLSIAPLSCLSCSLASTIFDNVPGIKAAFDQSLELKLSVMGIYFLLFPCIIAVLINGKGKLGYTKSTLKPTVYLLCYAFIPA